MSDDSLGDAGNVRASAGTEPAGSPYGAGFFTCARGHSFQYAGAPVGCHLCMAEDVSHRALADAIRAAIDRAIRKSRGSASPASYTPPASTERQRP